ncbi:hypothetical protein, partial [Microbulbifer sp. 2205BS26-8]|uniref:hypothetical protein n=1 Tax=Microbulbifer sp. 2205BS26-8 TaxID=3064386 RepID=UPI00273EA0A0
PIASKVGQGRSVPLTAERLVNMYPEVAPDGSRSSVVLHGCPGLAEFISRGKRVRGLHRTPSDGKLYTVIDNALFEMDAHGWAVDMGTIGGSGRVDMADNGQQLCIVAGQKGYIFTPAEGLREITDDSFPGADTITTLDGYFIFSNPNPGQRGQFFISSVLDG